MTVSTTDVKVPVSELMHGMYVSGLDRPWMDTPFILQGFVIDSYEDIEQLGKYCQFVYVDRNKSTGAAFFPDASTRKLLEKETIVIVKPADEPDASDEIDHRRLAAARPALARAKPAYDLTEEARARAARVRFAANRRAMQMSDGSVVMVERMSDQEARLLGAAQTGTSVPAASSAEPDRVGVIGGLVRWLRGAFDRERYEDLEVTGDVQTEDRVRLPRAIVIHEERVGLEAELPRARIAIERTRQTVLGLIGDIQSRNRIQVEKAREVADGLVESMERNQNAMMWVSRMKAQNATAYEHSIQSAVYLTALGLHVGLRRDEVADLSLAGLLLDVGKLRVPPELLAKPGRLTEVEFAAVKRHVQHGLEMIEQGGASDRVKQIVARHHEREDGSGYPHNLKGETIGMLGRMGGLIDTFVAITNPRPYADSLTVHDALRKLYRWRGRLFHEPLVEQLVQAIGVFPVGTFVELTTGDVAVVVAHNRVRRLKPRVLLLMGPDKQRLSRPTMLDLLYAPAAPDGAEVLIANALEPGAYGIRPEEIHLA